MKILLIAIGLLPIGTVAWSQYIIRYDVAREQIEYLRIRNGDTASTPVIRLAPGSRVNLQLVNAANSYRKQVSYQENTIPTPAPVIPYIGNTIQKILRVGGADDSKALAVDDIFQKKGPEKFQEMGAESEQQKAAKTAFAKTYNEFNGAYTRWLLSKQQGVLYEGLWKDLAVLRYSLQQPAENIRRSAREKTEGLFPGIGDNAGQIILQAGASSPSKLSVALQQKYQELKKAYESLRQNEVNPGASDALFREATVRAEQSGQAPGGEPDTEALARRISELYAAILNDSYGMLTPLAVNARTEAVELRFMPADSLTAAAAQLRMTDTVIRWIPVVKSGPLRFRNTIGFSFVSFSETRKSYFVSADSVIRRETGDQFQPVIVTYLHFYSPKDKGFRWGGSLGAGLPVGGDENKLNIMLGLSAFLGKNDPVCISLGCTGAQVKTLSGWKAGDRLPYGEFKSSDFRNVYRVGYFLALSFNPSALGN